MELIDRIYEAAIVPECWSDALGEMKAAAGSREGAMLLFSADAPPHVVGSGLPAGDMSRFRQLWKESPAVRWGLTSQPADFRPFDVPQDVLDSDPTITMLYDRGLGESVISVHPMGDETNLGFIFSRQADLGAFRSAEIAALNAMRPHLVRSGLVAARLGMVRARTMVDALERLGLAAAVIGPTGKVIAANALLEHLPAVLIATAFGGIALADRFKNERFREALARVSDGARGPALSIPVQAGPGQPALIVHLLPVRGQANDIFSGGHVLMVVSTITRKAAPRPELLHGLFDLTPAEARLTCELVDGGTLPAIAARVGLSPHTLRAQLRAIMAKTGTHRQTELMQLLTAL